MTEPADIRVEDILFNVLKHERTEALATIERWGKACELRIDGIEERPKRLSVEVRIRVRGNPENIATFCEQTHGRRSQDPPHTVRRWTGAIIEGIVTYWP